MKKVIFFVLIISVTISFSISRACARKVILSPIKTSTIISPSEARDNRLLLLFDLPEELFNKNVLIDFALIIYSAQVTDDKFMQIQIYPLTKEWKNQSEIKWDGHWNNMGGDFSTSYKESKYTLTKEKGNKEIQTEVTEIVRDWQNGKLDNHGIILLLSQDDLSNFDAKCSIDQNNIRLKIFYSIEAK